MDSDDSLPPTVGPEDDEEASDEAEDDVEDEEDDIDSAAEGAGGRGSGATAVAGDALPVRSRPTLASLSDPNRSHLVREIGHEAVWSLSTAKPGNGVEQIRDSSVDTYWQSDGGQPHLINVQFARRAAVCEVAFYLDYNLDESYTPKRLSIRSGTTFHDLEEIRTVELSEPVGWCSVPLYRLPGSDPLDEEDPEDDDEDDENSEEAAGFALSGRRKPIRTHFVQICVVSMHQNGRDTHVRQVKIFGPREHAAEVAAMRGRSCATDGGERDVGGGGGGGGWVCRVPRFQTVGMSQYSTIR